MKMFEKVKKCIIGIGTSLLAIPARVFASSIVSLVNPQPDYGVVIGPRQSAITMILKIVKFFIIPIAILVGLVTYLKKSKSSKTIKILVTIGIIVITA